MSEPRFFTVATYDEVYKAELAKTALEEEDIIAVLHDTQIVAADWMMSNAVGGVKLKVREEDGERACRILSEKMTAGAYLKESLSEDELTRQALAEVPEDEDEPPPPMRETVSGGEPADESSEEAASALREEYARRFLRVATFSIGLFPLWFVAFYLGLNAIFSPGRLSSEGHNRITYGIIACCFSASILFTVLMAFGPVFRN